MNSVDKALSQLASITNQRQARRIMDLGEPAALKLTHTDGREQWVINSSEGLYAVGYYNSLYMARVVSLGELRGMASGATDVTVVHEDVPDAVYNRPRGDGDAA